MKKFLSLGWGVQSFTIAAMVALGELPTVDAAIHADTTHESEHTYAFAAKWTPWLEERGVKIEVARPKKSGVILPLPSTGGATSKVAPPVYTRNESGKVRGQLARQCTGDWKVKPIRRYIRSAIGTRGAAELWLGISTDEVQRAKDSDVKYLLHRYPLLDLGMSRADCVTWLESRGLEVPPKSACHFCPFHNKRHWQEMKRENGSDWRNAVATDELIRHARPGKDGHELFIHASGKPLAEAVVIPEDYGAVQGEMDFDLDNAACDSGHCFM